MPFTIGTATLALSASTDMGKVEFWAAVGAILGVVLFFRGFQMLRYKRLILNTPSSKVRSASMGLVEVTGTAKGPQVIPAGITGDPCYYYRATAWKLKQSGNSRNWERVADESLYVPFFVDDSTGQMLVNAQGAQLDVHCNFKDEIRTSFFGGKDMVPPNVSRFLMRYGLVGVEGVRLEEYCIKPDYPLFVLGTLGRNPDQHGQQWTPESHVPRSQASHSANLSLVGPAASSALRALGWMPEVTVTVATTAIPFAGASVPPAGSIAPAVQRNSTPAGSGWASVSMDDASMNKAQPAVAAFLTASRSSAAPISSRTAGPSVAVAEPAAVSRAGSSVPAVDKAGFEIHPAVAIGKGADGMPFTISSRSQREVVQSLAWKSTLCIWGGPALTVTCLYFLSFALGWT
jgi:E3 Ubiquitin ligase